MVENDGFQINWRTFCCEPLIDNWIWSQYQSFGNPYFIGEDLMLEPATSGYYYSLHSKYIAKLYLTNSKLHFNIFMLRPIGNVIFEFFQEIVLFSV